jgi:ribosomal-protein-alanine N-acetyltransferase
MSEVPTFETERLLLRELVEADAPAYERYFVDYEVIRHLAGSVPWPYPDDGVTNYIRSDIIPEQGRERWVWAITRKENPSELIGVIELMRKANPTNRGFWLGTPFWGRGYMTEATSFVFTGNNCRSRWPILVEARRIR